MYAILGQVLVQAAPPPGSLPDPQAGCDPTASPRFPLSESVTGRTVALFLGVVGLSPAWGSEPLPGEM